MAFIPHTDADREAMLAAIGVSSTEDLFAAVPERFRFPELRLPEPLSELEVLRELDRMAGANRTPGRVTSFLGAGAYWHFVPSVVPFLASRGEYATAYTPYQPEVSQGTLQAIFEYQSQIACLTGMEAVNASHYDGATATTEAALMAVRASQGKRTKMLVASSVHPQYRRTLRTYVEGAGELVVVDGEDLASAEGGLEAGIDHTTACVVVQNPDFFGRIHDLRRLSSITHAAGALMVVVVNPILSLGLFLAPADYGADIVAAEGQSLGIPLSFGGPYLGILACRESLVRRLPGRLVGQTVDAEGRRGYVLTLTPREQHIRREKATSNICTNQGLVALMSGIYLAYMGRKGMRLVAETCYHKAHFAAVEIAGIPGFELADQGPFFDEFAVRCPRPVAQINQELLDRGIMGGYDLQHDYPERTNQMLLCVTEMNTRAHISQLVESLKEVTQ